MMRHLTIGCAMAALLFPAAYGQLPQEAVGKGEFPGLQFLPPGSILKGISLPRYENHRVTTLYTAAQMEVKSSSIVTLSKLRIFIYGADGDTTELATTEALSDFTLERVTATGKVNVTSGKFDGEGVGFVFDQKSNTGIVKGPVYTAVRTAPEKDAPTPSKK